MQALMLFGFALYYAAIAIALNWKLRESSLWFTSFLAIVLSQTILFGGDYLYRGHWETWNDIALVTSSAMCIAIVATVAVAFRIHRSKSANAPT